MDTVLTFDVEMASVGHYVKQQCGKRMIGRLRLINNGSETLRGLKVSVHSVTEEVLAAPVEVFVDVLPAGQMVEIPEAKELLLNSDYLRKATAKLTTEMVFTVSREDELLHTQAHQFAVMPLNYWENDPQFREQIAAYVTDNHRLIAAILRRASEILGQWTDSHSLNGYQKDDPDRVVKILGAIYAAIAERQIPYSLPLTDETERSGQFVRMTEEVLSEEGGMATCLDICVLFCSCAMAAGLNPTLHFFAGHVIAGVHLKDEVFPYPVMEDVDWVFKCLPADMGGGKSVNGSLLVLEGTFLNAGKNASFEDARVHGLKLLKEKKLEYTVDIRAARRAGVAALPVSQDKLGDGDELLYIEGGDERVDAPDELVYVDPDEGVPAVYDKPEQWMRRLLNITMRNPLLNSAFARTGSLPLYCGNVHKLLQTMADGREYELLTKPEDREAPKNYAELAAYCGSDEKDLEQGRLRVPLNEETVHKRAKDLMKEDKTSLEERGSSILYLSVGMLRWYESRAEKEPAHFAPILLYPVEMTRSGDRYKVRLREGEPMLNVTLMEKVRQDFQVEFPAWDTLPTADGTVDVQKILVSFHHAVRDLPRWGVVKYAGVATFNFADFVLWRDIRDNLSVLRENKLVDSLIDGYQKWESLPVEAYEDLSGAAGMVPVEADGSQLLVIRMAEGGETFVVQGPPGTGKSQCIVGAVQQALRKGMKVLLVTEKKAALEVVRKRLEEAGLGDVCLVLHSTNTKKGQVLEQLGAVLERAQQEEEDNKAFDATQQELGAVSEELDAYVRALHREGSCGMSLYELLSGYEQMDSGDDGCCFDPDELPGVETLDADGLKRRMECLSRLKATAGALGGISGSAVSHLGGVEYSQKFKHKAAVAVKNYLRALDELAEAADHFADSCERNEACDYGELQTEAQLATQLCQLAKLPTGWKSEEAGQTVVAPLRAAAEKAVRAESLRTVLLETWHETFLNEDSDALIRQFNEMAQSGALKRRWLLDRLNNRIKPLAKAYVEPETLRTHLIKLREYQTCRDEADKQLRTFKPLLQESFGEPPYDWKLVLETAEMAERADARIRSLTGGKETFRISCVGNIRCETAAERLMLAWEDVTEQRTALYEMLNAVPTRAGEYWIDEERERSRMMAEQVDMLKDWDHFNRACAEAEAEGMGCVVEAYCRGEKPEAINAAYRLALYRALICQAIDSDPVLSTFSGTVFNERIEQLRRLDKETLQLARKDVCSKVYGRIRHAVEKSKLENAELSTLKKAIRSRGRGLTLRKLFEQNLPLIQELCPCMMMSPHSVAQYLPMSSNLFDLVIFDEASQIPTSRAVGALARGSNAMVVGDCNQMPPTTFFSSTAVDEANWETEDLESVLDDCLALNMPETSLKWHYRSHESIIAFSNNRFYDNKLLTFPSAHDRSSHVHLNLVKDGAYDGGRTRRNPEEAAAVVEYLCKHCRDKDTLHMSVGIITFNIQQQKFLEELVQEACREDEVLRAWCDSVHEPLFIKNLENVQGDERDVILFSVNYGPDARGKVSMNFGPLNGEGGWRRLNVAVTRARHQMEVFSSLVPEQMDLSRTNARGVHELRAFLEYAGGGRLPATRSTLHLLDAPGGVAESLCRGLAEAGYEVERNVGCSDLRVDVAVVDPQNPQQYLMGILLDGSSYAGVKTTRDRELSQVNALKTLGWHVRRVWALDWFDNREKELRRILQELTALCEAQ